MKNNRTVSSRAKRISCLFGDGRREGRRGFGFMAFRGGSPVITSSWIIE